MKSMMAPAKTFDELQADVRVAIDAYVNASCNSYKGVYQPNTFDRIGTRIGHLWAQYINAVKIRDAAFDKLMAG